MRQISKCLVLVSLLLGCAVHLNAQDQKTDDVTTLINSARFLEQNPLHKQAKDVRRRSVEWIIATDKVSVVICPAISRNLGEKYKYSSEMFGQYTIGMAAYKLANPGKDENSAQVAGYESALLVYEGLLKEQPKAKHDFLDGLLAKRTDGTLAEFAGESCKEKK